MTENNKIPFYNRWWFWVIAVFLVIGIVNGGRDDDETVTSENNQSTSEENFLKQEENKENMKEASAEVNKDEANQEKNNKPAEGYYGGGTYKVGTDIPPDEYLIFADDPYGTYVENTEDSTGELDSIIYNFNLYEGAHAYVTVYEGEYLKLEDVYMYPVENTPSIVPEDGVYKDGMYKVGQDIPPGEYKVLLNEDSLRDTGYIEVTTDSRHDYKTIVTNDVVKAQSYITISEGQYLKLEGLIIETK